MEAGYPGQYQIEDEHPSEVIAGVLAGYALDANAVVPTSTGPEDLVAVAPVTNLAAYVIAGDDEDYNPELMARILRAGAAAPEAVFDNFQDMMDWLES